MSRIALPLLAVGLASAWIVTSGWYAPHPAWLVWVFALVGVVGACLLDVSRVEPPGYGRGLAALAGGIASWYLLPPQHRFVAVALLVAGVLGLRPFRGARAATVLAEVATLQLLALLLMESVLGRVHDLPWAAAPIAWVLEVLGESAAHADGRVTVATSEGLFVVRVTAELLQLPTIGLAWLAAMWCQHRCRDGRGAMLATTLLIAVWTIVRVAVIVVAALNTNFVSVAWSEWVTAVTVAPALALIPRRTRGLVGEVSTAAELAPSGSSPRLMWQRAAALAAGVLLACGASAYVGLTQFGTAKQGKVLIHEGNSDWESSLRPPGRDWFGPRAEYTFYGFRKVLSDYCETAVNKAPLTDAVLEGVSVLVLKTPTAPYSQAEVETVLRWVERGGSVFLIGEHTNVFGIAHYLNALAEPLGLRFRYDSQHGLVDYGLTTHRQTALCSHPATYDAPVFLFGSGCTLEPGLLAEDVILGRANSTARADYSISNFFSYGKPQLDRQFGILSQAAAACYGAGRAMAFTDSTVWSNFWMTMPAKSELMLGMVAWLQARNVGPNVKLVALLVLALGCLVLVVTGFQPITVVTLSCALPLAMTAVDWANRAGYRRLQPMGRPSEVVFCREAMDYFLPRVRLTPPEDRPKLPALSSFFAQPLRVELYSRETQTLAGALARNPRVMVLYNPTWLLPEEHREALLSYVRSGGRLLIITGSASEPEAVAALLGTFGLRQSAQTTSGPIKDARVAAATEAVFEDLTPFSPATLSGGEALLAGVGGTVAAQVRAGSGRVVVTTLGDLLQDSYFGNDNHVPTVAQLRVYRFSFWILRGLFDLVQGGELPAVPTLAKEFGADFEAKLEKHKAQSAK